VFGKQWNEQARIEERCGPGYVPTVLSCNKPAVVEHEMREPASLAAPELVVGRYQLYPGSSIT
jgi:hypothetical protein